ncbi:hypothetical protein SAMN00017405_0478 [Desulfonispora thiosulfatigenes DSM 11270]|uniref:Uncharacterized protein n=1 Tax=Desulfonispora thiosulfatigenes DSM 11270 TaxID=656914 RepID=A0A1W1V525_DESTI|nr:DUF5693 family protein [Desulfonispora thiosulfatigenes]SMB88452.1 hypothetical protein SAMN00017405_0478 [Desulfonispora thiosulfatigenes DSM 11270]
MKSKGYIKVVAYLFIALSIISSLYILNQRVTNERNNKNVEMIVSSSELSSLAQANDIELESLVAKLKERGITGVLEKEISLGDLRRTGKIKYYQGEELKTAPDYSYLAGDIPLSDANLFITLNEPKLNKQIIDHLTAKFKGIKVYNGEINVIAVPINIPNSDKEKEKIYENIDSYGVGFDTEELTELANLDLMIVPQIRDWKGVNDKSLQFVADEIKSIPNLSFILFNDEKVPGYPTKIQYLGELLKNEQGIPIAPIGDVEFFNQKGITNLATYLNKDAVRVHSISSGEMATKSPRELIERFELAVSERNIRTLFVRFFGMENPAEALETNLTYLQNIKENLQHAGFTIEKAESYPSMVYYQWMILIIGLGVLGGAALILLELNLSFLALIKIVLGALVWGALYYKSPILARKLMALASVMVFPILAFLKVMKEERRNLVASIFALLKLSAISFLGALFMVGLLSDKLFMLKLDQFIGVKLAHIIPLVVIPALLFSRKNSLSKAKELLDKALTYKVIIVSAIGILFLVIYVIRTGNVGENMVSGLEIQIREGLREILGVRPRTKEFLIGHPLTLLLLYYGLNKKNWLLIIPAVIGQVSLVNTYAHIHTPFLISAIRSLNGLWIGIIIGFILIIMWKWFSKYLTTHK